MGDISRSNRRNSITTNQPTENQNENFDSKNKKIDSKPPPKKIYHTDTNKKRMDYKNKSKSKSMANFAHSNAMQDLPKLRDGISKNLDLNQPPSGESTFEETGGDVFLPHMPQVIPTAHPIQPTGGIRRKSTESTLDLSGVKPIASEAPPMKRKGLYKTAVEFVGKSNFETGVEEKNLIPTFTSSSTPEDFASAFHTINKELCKSTKEVIHAAIKCLDGFLTETETITKKGVLKNIVINNDTKRLIPSFLGYDSSESSTIKKIQSFRNNLVNLEKIYVKLDHDLKDNQSMSDVENHLKDFFTSLNKDNLGTFFDIQILFNAMSSSCNSVDERKELCRNFGKANALLDVNGSLIKKFILVHPPKKGNSSYDAILKKLGHMEDFSKEILKLDQKKKVKKKKGTYIGSENHSVLKGATSHPKSILVEYEEDNYPGDSYSKARLKRIEDDKIKRQNEGLEKRRVHFENIVDKKQATKPYDENKAIIRSSEKASAKRNEWKAAVKAKDPKADEFYPDPTESDSESKNE